ncbi:MAG: hypothetical protein ACR2M4_08730 [Actinomycetota bacterium]
MGDYRNQAIQSVTCYERGTTGYIFGRRLQEAIGLDSGKLREVSFADETNQRNSIIPDRTSLLLTSDALFLAKEAIETDKPDIVLSYPILKDPNDPELTHPDLNEFLFTAVVTLQTEVIETNLWAVVTLLNALTHSIRLLRSETLSDDTIKYLACKFNTQIQSLNVAPEQRENLIRSAASFVFKFQGVAPADLRPTVESAEKALAQWKRYGDSHAGDVKHLIDQGPSLLVHREWRTQIELHQYLWRYFPNVRRLLASEHLPYWARWSWGGSSIFAIAFMFPGLLYALVTACLAPAKFSANLFAWTGTAVITYTVFVATLYHCMKKLRTGDMNYFGEILMWGWAVGAATLLSAVQLLQP